MGTVVSDKTIERKKNLPSERNLQKGSLLVNEISADPVSEVIFELSSETFPVCS